MSLQPFENQLHSDILTTGIKSMLSIVDPGLKRRVSIEM